MNESNGGNGNGHGIFQLAPKADPETLAIIDARRDARADTRLTRSMKACFDEIADRAQNPNFYEAKGIVTISDSVLAGTFGVSLRSIYTWKHQIAACGYVHLGRQPKSNMWPITKYYLTCLHRGPATQRTDRDGTYGVGRVRSLPSPPHGARQPGQPGLPLPGSRSPAPFPKNTKTPAISGQAGKKLPVSPEASCGSRPKPVAGLTRSQLRVSPEASCGSDPKPVAGETRNSLRVRPEANCEHLEDEVKGLSIQRGEAPPADDKELAFRTWEKRVADMRNSDLRKLEEVVAREFRDAKSETARDLAKRKLVTIRLQLRGPVAEDKPAAKPVRTDKPKPAAIPLAKRQELWGRAKTEAGL